MNQRKYRGLEIPANQVELARNLTCLEDLTDELRELQSTWNNLSLLGELAEIGTDISDTRQQFQTLANDLGRCMIEQCIQRVQDELGSKAQNSIDILVRNLFERTADIGFLCTDHTLSTMNVKNALDSAPKEIDLLRARLKAYVDKYSVYENVVLLDKQGQILMDLQGKYPRGLQLSKLTQKINNSTAYCEIYGKLVPHLEDHEALFYAWKLDQQAVSVAYIALVFNLQEESNALFRRVLNQASGENWYVCGVLDENQQVVFSSDSNSVPKGFHIPTDSDKPWNTLHIGPHIYLFSIRNTSGYQGYAGPGWKGFAAIPLGKAFEQLTFDQDPSSQDLPLAWEDAQRLLDPRIVEVKKMAERIQHQLNRSIWNGSIHQRDASHMMGKSFGKTLLNEIRRAGEQTKTLFSTAVSRLMHTFIERKKDSLCSSACLAMDLMDRNLYERANDCRWWALTGAYLDALKPNADADAIAKARASLVHTNGLYSVYTDILLINKDGEIISNSGEVDRSGQTVDALWVSHAMNLSDSSEYCVSEFETSALYAERNTYIYCAALFGTGRGATEPVGVIALVFDSEPQFEAILSDAGGHAEQSLAYIIDRQKRVISSNTDKFIQDGLLAFGLPSTCENLDREVSQSMLVEHQNQIYAMGVCASGSYREYKSKQDCYQNDLMCVYISPLGAQEVLLAPHAAPDLSILRSNKQALKQECLEIATFTSGGQWFAIPSDSISGAVDLKNLCRVPRQANYMLGISMVEGETVCLLDLEALLIDKPIANHSPDAYLQGSVVLLRSSGSSTRIGLWIKELGEISDVALSQINQETTLTGQGSLISGIIDTTQGMLSLLSVDKLFDMLKQGAPDAKNPSAKEGASLTYDYQQTINVA
ncbi:MAG: chemotaxis protein CheW [Limnobacter sp.]|nr:chemotaxis protein CheW [Limnobacter sp.]